MILLNILFTTVINYETQVNFPSFSAAPSTLSCHWAAWLAVQWHESVDVIRVHSARMLPQSPVGVRSVVSG